MSAVFDRLASVIEKALHDFAAGTVDTGAAVRAVIEAMREPDKVMIDAGIAAAEDAVDWSTDTNETYRCDAPSDGVRPVWEAMIDAALADCPRAGS